jgi:hypothetical protein
MTVMKYSDAQVRQTPTSYPRAALGGLTPHTVMPSRANCEREARILSWCLDTSFRSGPYES